MTGRKMYHIANVLWIFAAFSIVALIMSKYLMVNFHPKVKITFYLFVVIGAILRYVAKSRFPEVKDPIIENKLSRILYYIGNGLFLLMAFVVVIFHVYIPILFLASPLVILIPSWIISLKESEDKESSDQLLDDDLIA